MRCSRSRMPALPISRPARDWGVFSLLLRGAARRRMAAVVMAVALVAPMGIGVGRMSSSVAQTLTTEQAAALEEANRLDQQMIQLYQQGQYDEAIPLAQQALDIRETALGENHLYVATSLNNLAELYRAQGNYAAAEPLFQQSLAIRETALGENHPDVATSLNNLANLYLDQGNYAAAQPLLEHSLSIYETTFESNHSEVASILNNLATLYHDQGDYISAELLYQRSLFIYETAFQANHPNMARVLNNLGGLYQDQGNYAAAEISYQQSLALLQASVNVNHPDIATLLINLASLYQDQGDYATAEPLLQQSLIILTAVLGVNHPRIAVSLDNLARVYLHQGKYEEAATFYERSLSILETALDENHPDVASSFNNLARLYQEQGNYAAAEPLYQRSLSIYETALGENHPNVALSLNNLASLYQAQENTAAALPLLERAAESREAQLELTLAVISEARRRAYLSTLSGETNRLISLNFQDAPDVAPLALTTLLRRKGRVLDATAESYATLQQQLTPENQALLDELRQIDTQRANLFFGEPVEGQAELVSSLEARAEVLQNQLARASAVFRTETQPVTLEAVQQQIPADGALVELVRYEPFDAAASRQDPWGAPRYAAYVLFPSGDIRTVDLGDAAAMDAQVFTFLDALRNPRSNIQAIARDLDAQLMQPIRALTGDATHLLLSPDGALNLIPFAALMDESNSYLLERYTFTYLTSGRDLLRMDRGLEPGQGPVIVANPDYRATELAAASRGATPSQGNTVLTAQRSTDFSSLSAFGSLPGTETEADAILPLLANATRWDGAEATEAAIKQVQAPSILHLATHGFFLQDQDCLAVPGGTRTASIEVISTVQTDCVPTPRNMENPLLRSGLVFAGVNQRANFADGNDDGVLTAQEVTRMNLFGTQLVVLSACETGLGNVVNGDGVYGLRRAFVLAGAESQLMSLWKVDDLGTSDLMQGYYERLLAGSGRSESLRDIQQELLNTGAYQHPYYWAGFIASGNWRSLEGWE
ncbi:tetratricopeptide repeat protein [Leptolyngbya sp. CCY15150]|uniref:CHAT domain-containing tetratricopeptide repeat protein n=1 Tax=Leptolyngbya sp. CCY15150 TaxID=2767772 RepID=UPI00194E683B|nr:tetratricopeptide repeat protein [Leptolyngbya sp. CCY15150]